MQRYIAKELTHMVGAGKKSPKEQYDILVIVLRLGFLSHTPHDRRLEGNIQINMNASISNNEMYVPQSVCFCDIPLEELALHIKKYSPFGLSFDKDFIAKAGGSPVFYIAREAIANSARIFHPEFYELWEKASTPDEMQKALATNTKGKYFDLNIQEYLRQITNDKLVVNDEFIRFLDFHIFSYLKFFNHRLADDDPENYYFEREWRLIGNLSFHISDVKRIIIPEEYSKQFRSDFPDYYGQVTFSK